MPFSLTRRDILGGAALVTTESQSSAAPVWELAQGPGPSQTPAVSTWARGFLSTPDLQSALEALGLRGLAIPNARFDGSRNDGPLLARMLQRGSLILSTEPVLSRGALGVPRNRTLIGRGRDGLLQVEGVSGIDLWGGARLLGLDIAGGQQSVRLIRDSEGDDDISILLCRLDATTMAVEFDQPAARNRRIIGNRIDAESFALLFNEKMIGGSGFVIAANIIKSNKADALNFNFPRGASGNIAVVGNVLTAGTGGTGGSAGFALCLARTDGFAAAGNIYDESRNEAIHIEDAQRGTVIIGGVAGKCHHDGVRVLNHEDAEGVNISHHVFRAVPREIKQGVGIYQVWDKNGTIQSSIYIGNRIVGFEVGFSAGAWTRTILDKNVFEDCQIVIDAPQGDLHSPVELIGENLVKGQVKTLIRCAKGNITVGKLICETARPDTFVEKSDRNAHPGVTLRGFAFPIRGLAHPGGGNTVEYELFPFPTALRGRLSLRIGKSNGPNAVWRESEIIWRANQLFESNLIDHITGGIGGAGLVARNGTLMLTLSCVPKLEIDVWVDFEGSYYVA